MRRHGQGERSGKHDMAGDGMALAHAVEVAPLPGD